MAFRTKDRFEAGDILEVKMLLPARPPLGVIVYGNVIRADDAGNGETEIAMHFTEMLATSRELSFATWQERSLPRRLRDAVFWVFSPYL